MCGQDPEPVSRRLEVQRDESPAEGGGPVLHRQGESVLLFHFVQLHKNVGGVFSSGPRAKSWGGGGSADSVSVWSGRDGGSQSAPAAVRIQPRK